VFVEYWARRLDHSCPLSKGTINEIKSSREENGGLTSSFGLSIMVV
jgi:hypothetical protein